jgi:S-DNA-T family DNA segregation ATPase FtsK/SpoIIIE
MRSELSASFMLGDTGQVQAFLSRLAGRAAGVLLFLAIAFSIASLATWNVDDPSFSNAVDNPVTNAMGYPGAVVADLAMQFFGLASIVAVVPAFFWALFFVTGRGIDSKVKRTGAWFAGAVFAASVAGCINAPDTWPLPTGLGGVFGDLILEIPSLVIGNYPSGLLATILGLILCAPALWLLLYGGGLLRRGAQKASLPAAARRREAPSEPLLEEDEDEGRRSIFETAYNGWLSFRYIVHRLTYRFRPQRDIGRGSSWIRNIQMEDEFAEFDQPVGRADRVEPAFDGRAGAPAVAMESEEAFAEDEDAPFETAPRPVPSARVAGPAARPLQGARVQREAQRSLIGSDEFEMPSLHFLAEPKNVARDPSLSESALEQNARLLEGVLEDFGVKGEIIHVRPGPVVTLYELEPAPGIKSSRVIGLADDIARSMSAIACRVAVVPGRNAIGIELPNARRETVYLRELLASRDFEQSKAKLALALGKTINGEAVIADIAKFPHLLVAGTTGSGKSVAINTMILSILYRLKPEQCRLIMIDPKMLELSVYDGIPHLLTPVVTDPKKAVVALKWTVREMEDRYRKMSKVGVRNIEGFNQRVSAAGKKGEKIARTVQTGFDRQTGEAIYETEELDLEPLPFIVVIIDEMADLMMVAGKDIEGAVQRLAQMARAAGIHVIMATQRPSVDVITGTIKANFPTRISFQVTSKIDSRTILGEQGAEQLLGMGDMLYMAGGGRIQRVHGPFVSDDEVEKVVAHLKAQGVPEYLDAITEDDGEEGDASEGGTSAGGNFEDSDDPYDQAVAVVLRDGKASTSYIQRRLGIGYNRAASIIERMEQEGIVGPANHAGKREILVPTEEDKM